MISIRLLRVSDADASSGGFVNLYHVLYHATAWFANKEIFVIMTIE
jgi:hypothetical protein